MKFAPTGTVAIVWAITRIVLALYALILVVLYFYQERLIFFPETLPADFKFEFRRPFSERWIEADGTKAHGLLFKSSAGKGVVLYFHGNAGSLASWGEVAQELSERTGFDVWMIDYPGYGKSPGPLKNETQLQELAEAFWEAVLKEYPAPSLKIIFGRSVGTGIAVGLVSRHQDQADGLVLESPYRSLAAVAAGAVKWVPSFLLRILLKYQFDSESRIAAVRNPLLIFHGTNDEVIPFEQAKTLMKLVPNAKFVAVDGGHHNDLGNFDEYWAELTKWFSERSR